MTLFLQTFLLIGMMFSTILLTGCGSSDNVEQYETLKTQLGFDERDIHRLSTNNDRKKIDMKSVPTFVLGTVISVIDSSYSNTPIFNLKNLDDESLLDLDTGSGSRDYVSISMTSNKNATSFSYAAAADSSTSANFAGLIGAGVAVHADQSLSLANSDGNIYVVMNRGRNGSYLEINTEDLKAGYDFTPYLIGTALTETETKSYVDYTEKSAGKDKGTYIDTLIFDENQGHGQIDWAERNVYGNIQLLTKMETIYGLLREQYDAFEGEEAIQNILYSNMLRLKQKIGHAVQDFYAHVGTHFVSKLNCANYAYGYGTLQFKESSGNQEARLGVAVSLGGGIPSKLSVESGSSASFAQQNGWASAMKDLHIEAHSRPGGMDIAAFASEIMTILNDESQPLSVPNLSVPTSPKVEVLSTPDLKKKSSTPPDSVFSSYADWKIYQDELKKKSHLDGTTKDISEEVDEQSTDSLILEDPETDESSVTLYHAFVKEMELLKNQVQPEEDIIVGDGSNILRIEDMFVSGFETTEYESVIAPLRTSKIVLPEKESQCSNYPNATKLLMVINLFRQLADYTNFMNKFTISNISDDFNKCIENFYDLFSDRGYNHVTTHMSAGKDIDSTLLRGFALSMYGNTDGSDAENTKLFEYLGSDIDRFHYVKYLLDPKVMHLWRNAPGGYAPFFFDIDQSLRFAGLRDLSISPISHGTYDPFSCDDHHLQLLIDLTTQIHDAPSDIADLYAGRTESPLYPIFRYELKNDPKFLFLQLAGRYQLIYGKQGLISAFLYFEEAFHAAIPLNKDTLHHLIKYKGEAVGDSIPDMDEEAMEHLTPHIEGFDIDAIDNAYALYFPDKTQTKELREANRVIQLEIDGPDPSVACAAAPRQDIGSGWSKGYVFYGLYDALIAPISYNSGFLVNVDDGSEKEVSGFPVLLPIDYSKVPGGYGSLLLGSSFGTDNFIGSPTYDAAVTNSMHD